MNISYSKIRKIFKTVYRELSFLSPSLSICPVIAHPPKQAKLLLVCVNILLENICANITVTQIYICIKYVYINIYLYVYYMFFVFSQITAHLTH